MKFKLLSIVFVILIILTLTGCNWAEKDIENPEDGNYIDTAEFSGVKWVCREVDMHFYTLDFGVNNVIGEYIKDGEVFRLVGQVDTYGGLDFGFYSESNVSESIPGADGFLYAQYDYEDEVMICTVNSLDGLEIEETLLTFEKNDVDKTVKDSWKCSEIDMTMSSFNEIDGYYKGEIVINGENCNFLAFEIINGHYRFHVENGKINDLTEGTTPLIDMTLTEKDGKLFGKISAAIVEDRASFPYWDFGETELSFKKQ